MIKMAISSYYKKLADLWNQRRNSKPTVPYNDRMPKEIYIGSENENGYISWKVMDNDKEVDFDRIQNKMGFELHDDIKEYLQVIFYEMVGSIGNVIVSMTPITPLVDIEHFILKRYQIANEVRRDNKLIEIGLAEIDGADGLLLCIDNNTGKVIWLDVEKGESGVISTSIYDLISTMEPRC